MSFSLLPAKKRSKEMEPVMVDWFGNFQQGSLYETRLVSNVMSFFFFFARLLFLFPHTFLGNILLISLIPPPALTDSQTSRQIIGSLKVNGRLGHVPQSFLTAALRVNRTSETFSEALIASL